ncbi:catechol 2,3-dioxygenase-like lactoylglutathione lyase family enzyme [Nakamurella sp. UYEF19]|uniref:VOC family protein n=1 Tax=Nakamurella sp. UYEF19 TaxID=1756392 RepID=UPI003397F187
MTTPTAEADSRNIHRDLHSEQGSVRGERPDRARNPVIKAEDLAWLEFQKPDLDRAEKFAHDFGFTTVTRTPDSVSLRGALAGSQCLVIRRGRDSRFVAPVFRAADRADLDRLARATDSIPRPLDGPGGGAVLDLHDPSGSLLRVVAGIDELSAQPLVAPLTVNVGGSALRTNAVQRPPVAPAQVQRLGHVVLETTSFQRSLDWYQHHLGLIVSDFLFFPGQRGRGPTMAFIRCDRGGMPADHHTLAMHLGPSCRYIHSAYQVADLDAVAAGGRHLAEQGYRHAWGIGRHIQGSQIFDYWRDPDKFMVEHFTDGDLFDSSVEAGWAPMTASGLSQWGPPVTRDFLDATPSPRLVRELVRALRDGNNEFDVRRLVGLLKVATS